MTNGNTHSSQSLESKLQQAAAEAEVSYLNVMQTLVEEKVDKCIKSAGVCPCPRCRIDVIALTLSKLPSKYVVLENDDAIPVLSVYENRCSINILAQLMSSCEVVKAHPRHNNSKRGAAFVR